ALDEIVVVEIELGGKPKTRAVGRRHRLRRARAAVPAEGLLQQRRRRRRLRDLEPHAFAEYRGDQEIEPGRDVGERAPPGVPPPRPMFPPELAREYRRMASGVRKQLLGLAHRRVTRTSLRRDREARRRAIRRR